MLLYIYATGQTKRDLHITKSLVNWLPMIFSSMRLILAENTLHNEDNTVAKIMIQ